MLCRRQACGSQWKCCDPAFVAEKNLPFNTVKVFKLILFLCLNVYQQNIQNKYHFSPAYFLELITAPVLLTKEFGVRNI
jgi:hypothetical protein